MPTREAEKRAEPINIARDAIRHLLDMLDNRDAGPTKGKETRRAVRRRYRSIDVIVHLLNDYGDTKTSLQVATRNLSASGLAFLHRRVLHVGQPVEVRIPLMGRHTLCVMAKVVRCRHVQGMVHEIGVRFMDVRE